MGESPNNPRQPTPDGEDPKRSDTPSAKAPDTGSDKTSDASAAQQQDGSPHSPPPPNRDDTPPLPTEGYDLAEPIDALASAPASSTPTARDRPAPAPQVGDPDETEETAPSSRANRFARAVLKGRVGKQLLSSPPQSRARLAAWLVLLGCLLVAAIPMSLDLGRPAVIHEHEARSLAIAVETWRHQVEWTYADHFLETLVPAYNHQPQLEAPPGTTWLHLIAFRALGETPDTASTSQLVLAGRLVSLVCGLVTVASVFWIGLTIGSLRTATLAALVAAAHPLLLLHSRLAGVEMPQMAVMTLTIAAAVWAIRPLNMPGGLMRQGTAWVLCGLALAVAVLIGGLSHLPLILIPILLFFVLYPHRLSHLMGLVAAGIIAVLATLPWALYVYGESPEVWGTWVSQLVPAYFEDPALLGEVAGQRLMLLVAVTLPWTAWLAAGLVQPMSTSSAGARLRMMLGWMWFVPVALLLLAAPGEPTMTEIMMAIPATALLVGQVIRQFSDLSDEGRHARMWRLLRWPHAFVLMFASVALPAVGHFQEGMVRAGWLPGEVALAMPMGYWLGLGVVLMGVVIVSMRFAEQHHPGRAVACWAVWVIVAVGAIAAPVARGPMMNTPLRPVGAMVREATAGAPLYWLGAIARDEATGEVVEDAPRLDMPPQLLLYSRRELRPIHPDQLEPLRQEHRQDEGAMFVLAADSHAPPAGFEPVQRFAAVGLKLWRAEAPAAPQETEQQDEPPEQEDD